MAEFERTEKLLLGVHEVSVLVGLCERSVWRMAAAGKMPKPVCIGRARRWRRDELMQWIAAGCQSVADRK